MVDRDQGHPQTVGHRLGEAKTHQHCADEARCVGHRHGVDICPGAAGVSQRLFCQGGNGLHVLPGGDLRHHAAVQGVEVRLGCNGVGQDLAAVLHHRHGGLVAGGFKSQYLHMSRHFFLYCSQATLAPGALLGS